MVALVSDAHPENVEVPMLVMFDGSAMLVSAEQPEKAEVPMLVTL